jgi:hypothetical protein
MTSDGEAHNALAPRKYLQGKLNEYLWPRLAEEVIAEQSHRRNHENGFAIQLLPTTHEKFIAEFSRSKQSEGKVFHSCC